MPTPKKPARKPKPAPKPKPAKKAAKAKPKKQSSIAKAPPPKPAVSKPARAHPVAVALASKSAKDRVGAARKAGQLGREAPPEVIAALVAALELDAETRAAAIEALTALGNARRPAMGELAGRLGEGTLEQRSARALALARIDAEHLPAALPVLAELVTIGAASERALIREVLALVPALGLHALPLLPALLMRLENAPRDEAEGLVQAVRGAGALGAEAVFKAAQEGSGAYGARLVALLEGYDRAEHTGWLGELARHTDAQVRRAAIEALGRRGGREVLAHLLRALSDADDEVLAASRAGLRKVPAPVLAPVLAAYLTHLRQDPPEARDAAVVHASDLGVAGFEDIGPLLLDALGDRDAAVRTGAARGLEALAPTARAALPRLRAQRKDSSPDVRAAVESAIAAIERSAKR